MGLFLGVIILMVFTTGCAEDVEYIGGTRGGLPHGSGTLTYPGGTTYSGDFKEGKRHGKGIWMHQSGTTYSGEWKDDLYHGEGILEIPHHFTYEGEFVEGKKEGYGIQNWFEGKRYEGYWENDRMHGEGTMYYPDGSYYAGNWEQGLRSGQGTLVTADEEIVSGEWSGNEHIYIAAEMISLNREELTLKLGDDPYTLDFFIFPPEASSQQVEWASSDSEVVEVTGGLLTPRSPGRAVVTATAVAEELEAECRVVVVADQASGTTGARITSLSLEPATMTMRVGDEQKRFRVVVTPAGAATGNLIWSSSHENIAIISSSGIIRPIRPGRTTIIIRTPDNRLRATADLIVMGSLEVR